MDTDTLFPKEWPKRGESVILTMSQSRPSLMAGFREPRGGVLVALDPERFGPAASRNPRMAAGWIELEKTLSEYLQTVRDHIRKEGL